MFSRRRLQTQPVTKETVKEEFKKELLNENRFQFEEADKPFGFLYYRTLLKDKRWFKLEMTGVQIHVYYEASCSILFEDLDYIDVFRTVESEFEKRFGYPKMLILEETSNKVYSIDCKVTPGTKFVDPMGTTNSVNKFGVKYKALANVDLIFYAIHNKTDLVAKSAGLMSRATKIQILAMESDKNREIGDLPTYGDFKTKTNVQERKKCYPSRKICSEEENSKIGYVLVQIEEKGLRIINTSLYKQLGLNGLIHPQVYKEDYGDKALDFDDKSFHYAVVMTYSDRKFEHANEDYVVIKNLFMEKARKYIEMLEIDVRGFWYDESSREKRAHCNLHVVSPLPLAYFQVLFDKWTIEIGQVVAKRVWEPIGWRLYASRNHNMFTTTDKYTPGTYVYEKFVEEMEGIMDKDLWLCMPLELVMKIMEYGVPYCAR